MDGQTDGGREGERKKGKKEGIKWREGYKSWEMGLIFS